jgi:hypothetical protein
MSLRRSGAFCPISFPLFQLFFDWNAVIGMTCPPYVLKDKHGPHRQQGRALTDPKAACRGRQQSAKNSHCPRCISCAAQPGLSFRRRLQKLYLTPSIAS